MVKSGQSVPFRRPRFVQVILKENRDYPESRLSDYVLMQDIQPGGSKVPWQSQICLQLSPVLSETAMVVFWWVLSKTWGIIR